MPDTYVHVPIDELKKYRHFFIEHSLNPELYISASALDAMADPAAQVRAEVDAFGYGPSVTIHAPFMDLSPGAVDEKIREVTLERFSRTMDAAEAVSAKAVVFHSGFEKWKYAHKADRWLTESVRTWTGLIKRAEASGIKIAIENIFENEPSNLVLLMKELASEHFGVCFDTGHCNLFTTVPLSDWIGPLKEYILELHVHDNDTTSDAHLPIGEGTFDFDSFFKELKGTEGLIYTIEVHTPEHAFRSLEKLLKGYLSGS